MDSTLLVKTICLGSAAGFIGGVTGSTGLGAITSGLLILGISNDMKNAVGTTLATTLIPVSIGSVYTYYQRNQVNFPVAFILIICVTIMSYVGACYTKYISNAIIKYYTAVYCFALSIFFFCSAYFNWR